MLGQNLPSFSDDLLKRDSLPILCLSQSSLPNPSSAYVSYHFPMVYFPPRPHALPRERIFFQIDLFEPRCASPPGTFPITSAFSVW